MKFPILFSLLFLSFSFKAQINATIPDWVNVIDIKTAGNVNKKQIKDGYYHIIADEQYNTIKKHTYFHYATSAITEEALTNVSQIEFSYDPSYQKAVLHFVKIHRNGTVIDKTATLELKVLNEENQRNMGILDGRKTLYTNLSDVRKGDIIEYSFSKIGENPILKNYFNINLWLSYSVPVGKIYTRVIFPKNSELSILNRNSTIKPVIKVSDVSDYVWEVNNPKVTTLESSTPQWYSPYSMVQVSNIKNWGEVKEHCRSLLKVSDNNSKSLKKIVDSIARSTSDPETQITSVVEFVQTHIRYSGNENGIYSHTPRSPEFVIKNRYGDCKEKTVLLNEMLKQLNIEAYPVLINTSAGKKILQQNPSINAFDHCISCFYFNDKHYFIDPTISYQRGNFKLRILPDYEIGMVLNNSPEPFETIPIDRSSKTSMLEEFTIEKSGDALLKVTTICNGTKADELRYTFLTNSVYDIQDTYKDFYTKYVDDIEVIDTVKIIDNETTNECTMTEVYLLKKFWVKDDSSRSKSISKDFVPYSLNYKLNYAEDAKRNDPLQISFPVNHTQTITVYKAEGWNVPAEKKHEDNKYFAYTFEKKVMGETLILSYDYVSKTNVIEAKDYTDYHDKMQFINYNMVFSSEEKPLAEGTVSFNWLLLLTLLSAAILCTFLIIFLYKKPYQSVYINQYDSIGGWLVLIGIGVTFNPIILLFSLYTQYHDEFQYNYYVFFFSVDSTSFSPMKGYFNLFIAFVNAFMVVFTVFIAILFYQKKASFRLYYSIFRIFNVVFLIVNVIILNGFYGNSSDPEERALISSETSAMIKVFIQTCIWVPYLWFSERSKHTFTNPNTPDKNLSNDGLDLNSNIIHPSV